MQLFIWKYLEELTGSYHDGGGVVIAAGNLRAARDLLAGVNLPEKPDVIYELAGSPDPEVFIFPDAGCC